MGFTYIAIKKFNDMVNCERFVAIVSVDETGIIVQNKTGFQHIDMWGRCYNGSTLEELKNNMND